MKNLSTIKIPSLLSVLYILIILGDCNNNSSKQNATMETKTENKKFTFS